MYCDDGQSELLPGAEDIGLSVWMPFLKPWRESKCVSYWISGQVATNHVTSELSCLID